MDTQKENGGNEVIMFLLQMMTFVQAVDFLVAEGKMDKMESEEKMNLANRFKLDCEIKHEKMKEESEKRKVEAEAARQRDIAILESRNR